MAISNLAIVKQFPQDPKDVRICELEQQLEQLQNENLVLKDMHRHDSKRIGRLRRAAFKANKKLRETQDTYAVSITFAMIFLFIIAVIK